MRTSGGSTSSYWSQSSHCSRGHNGSRRSVTGGATSSSDGCDRCSGRTSDGSNVWRGVRSRSCGDGRSCSWSTDGRSCWATSSGRDETSCVGGNAGRRSGDSDSNGYSASGSEGVGGRGCSTRRTRRRFGGSATAHSPLCSARGAVSTGNNKRSCYIFGDQWGRAPSHAF